MDPVRSQVRGGGGGVFGEKLSLNDCVLAAARKVNVSGSESVSTAALRRKRRILNAKVSRTRDTRLPSPTRTGPGARPVQRMVRPPTCLRYRFIKRLIMIEMAAWSEWNKWTLAGTYTQFCSSGSSETRRLVLYKVTSSLYFRSNDKNGKETCLFAGEQWKQKVDICPSLECFTLPV